MLTTPCTRSAVLLGSRLCPPKPATPSKFLFATMATASPTPIASSIPSSPPKRLAREPASALASATASGRSTGEKFSATTIPKARRPHSSSAFPQRPTLPLWVWPQEYYKNDKPRHPTSSLACSSHRRRAFYHGSGQRYPRAQRLPSRLHRIRRRSSAPAGKGPISRRSLRHAHPRRRRWRSGPFLDFHPSPRSRRPGCHHHRRLCQRRNCHHPAQDRRALSREALSRAGPHFRRRKNHGESPVNPDLAKTTLGKEERRIRLLVVDDEQSIRKLCMTVGEALGFVCFEADSGESALALLEEQPVHMVLSDMVMPHMSGLEFLEKVKKLLPRTEVALMTGHGSIETAVQSMRLGAYDYITKPFSPLEELRLFLRRMAEKIRLVEENEFLRQRMDSETAVHGIVGSSAKIQEVLRVASRLKDTRTAVLISGR